MEDLPLFRFAVLVGTPQAVTKRKARDAPGEAREASLRSAALREVAQGSVYPDEVIEIIKQGVRFRFEGSLHARNIMGFEIESRANTRVVLRLTRPGGEVDEVDVEGPWPDADVVVSHLLCYAPGS